MRSFFTALLALADVALAYWLAWRFLHLRPVTIFSLIAAWAVVVLACVAQASFDALRKQADWILRREHLNDLKSGPLRRLRHRMESFYGKTGELVEISGVMASRWLPLRERSGRLGEPLHFSFDEPLLEELRQHFRPLMEAIEALNRRFETLSGLLWNHMLDHLEPKLNDLLGANWTSDHPTEAAMLVNEAYRRAALLEPERTERMPAVPSNSPRAALTAVLQSEELRHMVDEGWQHLETEFKNYREQMARAGASVRLEGHCDLIGKSGKA